MEWIQTTGREAILINIAKWLFPKHLVKIYHVSQKDIMTSREERLLAASLDLLADLEMIDIQRSKGITIASCTNSYTTHCIASVQNPDKTVTALQKAVAAYKEEAIEQIEQQ